MSFNSSSFLWFLPGPQGDNTIVPDLAAAQTGELGGIMGGVGGRPGLGGPGGLGGTTPGGKELLCFFYCSKILYSKKLLRVSRKFISRKIWSHSFEKVHPVK